MEHSPYIIEDNAYSGTSPFSDLRSAGDQQTFNGTVGELGFLGMRPHKNALLVK